MGLRNMLRAILGLAPGATPWVVPTQEDEKRIVLSAEIMGDPARRGYASMTPEEIADSMTNVRDVAVPSTPEKPDPLPISRAALFGFRVQTGLVHRTLRISTGNDLAALDRAIARGDRDGLVGPSLQAAKAVDRQDMDATQQVYTDLDDAFQDPTMVYTRGLLKEKSIG